MLRPEEFSFEFGLKYNMDILVHPYKEQRYTIASSKKYLQIGIYYIKILTNLKKIDFYLNTSSESGRLVWTPENRSVISPRVSPL